MAKEENTTETTVKKENKIRVRIPFTGILEILANKDSRKGTIIAMAMVLIYLLAATPNVAEVLIFVGAITGLAIFFTFLQWIVDLKDDKKDKKGRSVHKDPPPNGS